MLLSRHFPLHLSPRIHSPIIIMTTFAHLPYELRTTIWKIAAYPRIVKIRWFREAVLPANLRPNYWEFDEEDRTDNLVYFKSPTPAPAVMQVCQESRKYAPYERAFTDGSRPRYVWVNWDLDTIFTADETFGGSGWCYPEYDRIRRLKFHMPKLHVWPDCDHLMRPYFSALKELYVLSGGPLGLYRTGYQGLITWAFAGPHSIFCIDKRTGLILSEGGMAELFTFLYHRASDGPPTDERANYGHFLPDFLSEDD